MEYKIIRKYSPNKMSRNGWKPDMIVSHITEGSYNGAVSWLMNPKSGASSHFVISKRGEITQLVDIKEAAWINGTSIKPTEKSFYNNSTLRLVRERKTNANYYTIGIEHEGFYSENRGKLTPEQLKATIWLHKYIRSEVKKIYGIDIPLDREHIVGHYQIDPKRKINCPGQAFQFDEILRDLKGIGVVNVPNKNIVKVSYKGKQINLDGFMKDDINYVQIRQLLEALGFKVGWDNITKTVIIND